MHAGIDDDVTRARQRQRLDAFADALGPGTAPVHEDRHVRSQLQAQRSQLGHGEPRAPQVIERDQRAGGIGAAAAQTAAHRNTLGDAQIGAASAARVLPQQVRGAQHQILLGRHLRDTRTADQTLVVAQTHMQVVAPVQQTEHGLQQVIAVLATTDDAQKQIELGRRRPDAPRVHGVDQDQCSIDTRTR
ncbi:hypothetical protein LF63_0111260 [Oleiagrimonas soli]|uniref:Uncharacterized protein n=1 Tax=Oleiagrimonas soli TaxID=1543381 RepID=A0A099CTS1_9GAMM|nr:hypothetical protein LF63_0111260 [Oleiagrimonas soli]